MATFQYIKNKLSEEVPCTVGFKAFMYFSFAAVWFNFVFGG